MLRIVVNRLRCVFAVLIFELRILRWCGLRLFLRSMVHQLYWQRIFLVTIGQLDAPRPSSSFQCTASLASPDDIDELFGNLHQESPEGRYQLIDRKYYHEVGLGDCYVTRANNTNEICTVRWVVTPEHVKRLGWEDRYPLEDDEIMFENLYTFEKYRREGARTASSLQMKKIVLQQGFKRNKGNIEETNIPQREWGKKAGNKVCERILERHFLFRITRKTLERYDPPIPMADLTDIE